MRCNFLVRSLFLSSRFFFLTLKSCLLLFLCEPWCLTCAYTPMSLDYRFLSHSICSLRVRFYFIHVLVPDLLLDLDNVVAWLPLHLGKLVLNLLLLNHVVKLLWLLTLLYFNNTRWLLLLHAVVAAGDKAVNHRWVHILYNWIGTGSALLPIQLSGRLHILVLHHCVACIICVGQRRLRWGTYRRNTCFWLKLFSFLWFLSWRSWLVGQIIVVLSLLTSLPSQASACAIAARFLLDTSFLTDTFLFTVRNGTFLLQEMLNVHIVRLKILDQSLALTFDFHSGAHWCSLCSTDFSWENSLWLHCEDGAVYRRRQGVESCWVRHAKLQSFFQGLLNCIVMAEALPLSINWIYTTSREVTLLDEALPIDLVLVFLTWELLCHIEDLDQLTHGETCPLAW